MVRVGRIESGVSCPVPLQFKGRSYLLLDSGAGFNLVSTVCPHQGGEVAIAGDKLECPLHHWTFDRSTGQCLNVPRRHLESFPAYIEDGYLYADLPETDVVGACPSHPRENSSGDGLSIGLLSHACLDVRRGEFSLLTDPWLVGRAFLGSWIRYPSFDIDAASLRPDALILTHEHSDHFHEDTLRLMNTKVPTYVPDFPNQRMQTKLRGLGFTDVRPMRFGNRVEIAPDWSITMLEPESIWNDAMCLIECGGFRVLNINDSGLNRRIAPLIGSVDLVASQFSTGASGYPWTWDHLSQAEKVRISERSCTGKLALLRDAVEVYGARMLLPFASHFSLWHPTHMDYLEHMTLNSLPHVKKAFEGSDVRVLDLLPGDMFHAGTGEISRHSGRHELIPSAADRIARAFEEQQSAQVVSPALDPRVTRDRLVTHLLRLNETSEIVHCENLTGSFDVCKGDYSEDLFNVSFAIEEGRLRISETVGSPNLAIRIPLEAVSQIIDHDLSWDEAFIGYWCRFDRDPDVYHAGFWRLMQSPSASRKVSLPKYNDGAIGPHSVIAEILEDFGDEADRILKRYGLYCLGCQHSTQETVANAALQHGLEQQKVEILVRELARTFDPR